MKIIINLTFLFISLSTYSKKNVISSAGVEFLTCGQYEIRGLLGSNEDKTIHFLQLYPSTKRQYKIVIDGDVSEFFRMNTKKVHVTASGVIKRKGKASSLVLHLDKKLEILNPNDRFKDVIVKKKDLSCI